jgi:non-specific serine/threonine protein kinase
MWTRVAGLIAVVLALAGCSPVATRTSPDEPTTPAAGAGTLAWRGLAAVPTARTEVAAAASAGHIYVMGGFTADGATVGTVEVIDLATGRWARGPDLPVAVNHAMAATVGDVVHVFGGYLDGNVPSAAAFRLEGGAWRTLAPPPQARAAGTAVAVDGAVYVAGGIAAGGGLAGAMLRYDTAANQWSTVEGPPTPREHLGGAGYDGRVYTVGGRTAAAGNLVAFEVFDTRTGTWSRLPELPTRRGGLAATATCSGRIIAVGGEAAETFDEVEAFDVVGGQWSALPPLPTPRHGLGVVAVGTVLYTLAGGPHPGLFVADTTEVLDTAPLGPCR